MKKIFGFSIKGLGMIPVVLVIAHLLGFVSSINALMTTRTSQGAIAWIVALNSFPVVSVPAYWVFGRNKFKGYVKARQALDELHDQQIESIRNQVLPFERKFEEAPGAMVGEQLAQLPFLGANGVELLIDGEQTFDSIMEGIARARKYILVQFYIIRDDGLGRRLKQGLIDKAREGVRIYLLYDEIGSHALPRTYIEEMRDAGIAVHSFHSTRGKRNRFQINFRNHRKIVVVDGKAGWVGGHNVGDEYLGKDPKFGPWRDTHVKITGPAVLEMQVPLLEDYHWATGKLLELDWNPVPAPEGDAAVLILPSGPADELETASLMYQQAIHSARQRIWIASPYFVPDESVLSALHLAVLRGVEIKILIPDVSDSKLVYYSTYAFIGELLRAGIQIYRYQPGFLHEKVFLVDDRVAGIGTANFDNRSFRLNFEVTALVVEAGLISAVGQMFQDDFARSTKMEIVDVENKPWWFQVLARASYLTAPIQ
ncbi:MAG: cardiolipin synthase [Proteobacteria bacterium]|nr:cardiolipin synthase [Pseudomonadota bacterium]